MPAFFEPASVLVYVLWDHIGDGISKLPFVRTLREAFAEARITWLAGAGPSVYATTLEPLASIFLDEVLVDADVGVSPLELVIPRRPLPGRAFDLIIDTQRTVYRSLILRRVSHKMFVSAAAGFLLSDIKPRPGFTPPPSMLGQLLALLDLVGARPADPSPMPLPLPEFRRAAAALLPSGPAYVGFAPGAGNKRKCWPLERYIAVASDQAAKQRVPVFFLGPKEKEWLTDLHAAVPEALFPEWNRTDPYGEIKGPLLVMALAERLAAAVSNDCGTGHMLAAGAVPMVSLFGPTDAEKFAPATPQFAILRAAEFGGRSMEEIPVDAVIAVLEKQVAASRSGAKARVGA